MGYDHIWKLETPLTKPFLEDTKKIIEQFEDILEVRDFSSDKIFIDGIGDKGYESFIFFQNPADYKNWCKTDAREYDEPLCMILLVALYHFQNDFYLNSAGFSMLYEKQYKEGKLWGYWNKALTNVKEVFGYEFEQVLDVDIEDERWSGWYYIKIRPIKNT
jgi:hypothetical protein